MDLLRLSRRTICTALHISPTLQPASYNHIAHMPSDHPTIMGIFVQSTIMLMFLSIQITLLGNMATQIAVTSYPYEWKSRLYSIDNKLQHFLICHGFANQTSRPLFPRGSTLRSESQSIASMTPTGKKYHDVS